MPPRRPTLAGCLVLLAGCTFNLDRTLSPGQIRGRAVFASSTGQTPAANGLVTLQGSALSATTSSDGNFVLNGLPPGSYTLTIEATQGGVQEGLQLENLALGTSGAPDGLDLGTLVLERLGSIAGTVQLSGMDADGATVVLTGIAQAAVSSGQYTFTNLPPGDYTVGALDAVDLDETSASAPQSVHVNAGVQTMLDLVLSVASYGSISGFVQLASTSASVESVAVVPESPDFMLMMPTSPGPAGNYAYSSLPPGIFTVSASLTGFVTVSVPFVLVGQGTTVVPTITLFSISGSDGGPPDAGSLDGGSPDAGPLDSGSSDSGPSDAGLEDAGTVTVSTIAGTHFSLPSGLARDSSGNLYVADTSNCAIDKIDPAGDVSIYAGLTAGCAVGAPLSNPRAVTVDDTGTVYVADTGHNRVCMVGTGGVVSVVAGNGGSGDVDGTPGATGTATFSSITGLAGGVDGNLFVADNGNTAIRRIDADGGVWAFAGGAFGLVSGQGQMAGFESVANLAVSSNGDVFVADPDDGCIRRIDAFGAVTNYAGLCLERAHNYMPGPAGTATFSSPEGVAVDAAGYLYVADSVANVIARVDPAGNVTTLAGQPGQGGDGDGPATLALFNTPMAIAVNAAGTQAWVADELNDVIRQLDIPGGSPDAGVDAGPEDAGSSADGGIWFGTLAGIQDAGYVNGPDDTAEFNNPGLITLDSDGVYVGDIQNEAIRRIGDGGVTTLAGGPDAGVFGYMTAVTTDGMGDLYVADQTYKCIWVVFGVDTATPTVQCFWGNCNGSMGKVTTQPEILTSGLATDSSGNLYVSDEEHLVVWLVESPLRSLGSTPATVFAGTMDAGTITDGQPGTFNSPAFISIDRVDGTVWVVDYDANFEGAIRAVDASGSVRTVYYPPAQRGSQNVYPESLLVDPAGNVYFSDSFSGDLFRLEVITATGIGLTTLASSTPGFADGSGGLGGSARINTPFGMAAEPTGVIVFGDSGNNRVRTIQLSAGATGLALAP